MCPKAKTVGADCLKRPLIFRVRAAFSIRRNALLDRLIERSRYGRRYVTGALPNTNSPFPCRLFQGQMSEQNVYMTRVCPMRAEPS